VKDKKLQVVFLIAAVLTILTTQCYRPPAELETIEIGQAAPQFMLRDLDGREVSLEQYKGKIVILDFWATWCGPCRVTMPMLDRLQEEYSGKLVLLAVNQLEPKNMVREYVLRENLSSRVLLDEDGSVGSRYEIEKGIPLQVIIDQNGIAQYLTVGVPRATGVAGLEDSIKAEINKLL